ncbi:MAG TPA: phosphotransferase [Polyangiaceae bacterium]|nr:phosphotransferase [Polyangiaceae bacterium]
MRPHPLVIAESIAQWGEPFVELAIFGTADAAAIAAQVDSFCREHLGAGVAGALFEYASIGNVHGLVLEDGRRVVLKAHQPTMELAHLRAVQRCVRHLSDAGFPAPRPLVEVAPLARGHAWVEEMLDRGTWEDPHRPDVRRAMAEGLAEVVRLCERVADVEGLRCEPLGSVPEGRLWPVPHSKLFDFEKTAKGAENIDALARAAREVLARGDRGPRVVGHHDLRAEHVRFERRGGVPVLVATYDWDSLMLSHETSLLGVNAHAFAADWSTDPPRVRPAPSLDEARAYVAEYEQARGHRFTNEQRLCVGASFAYAVAYTARCGHALGGSVEEGSFGALARRGEALLRGWS